MIRPLDNRLLVKPLPKEKKIGILDIPDQHQKQPNKGEIIAVGNNINDINVGEIAIYEEGFGVDFEEDGVIYRVLERKHIFAIK